MEQGTLQSYINEAINAAEYAAEAHVFSAIRAMGHRDFAGQEIIFDLRGKNWATMNKPLIEKAVAQRGPDFQKRVRYIES